MHKRMAMGKMAKGGMSTKKDNKRDIRKVEHSIGSSRSSKRETARKMMGGGMGGRSGDMMYSRGYGVGEKSKRMPTMLQDRGAMKKGGVAKKKKPMKGRMSPARRVTGTNPNRPINPTNPGFPFTPRPRPQQKRMMGGGVAEAARKVTSGMKQGGLKAVDKKKNPGLAKLPTSVRNKMGYMKRGGSTRNTRRMNRLEELGRVDAEKAYTRKGKRNLKSEKKRIVKELKK